MNNAFLIIGITLLVGTIIFLTYYFKRKTIILRRLKKLRHQPINSLKTNIYSKIEGVAININEPLIAPLSKRKCVFYKIKIEQEKGDHENSYWRTLKEEENIQDFFIEQNEKRLIILPTKVPKNYYDYLVTDKKTHSGTFNDPTPEFKALLNHFNIDSEGFFGFNKQLRYSEAIIEIGEPLVVAGFVKWMTLESPIADYNYSRVATLVAKDNTKILITDSPDALRPKYGHVKNN